MSYCMCDNHVSGHLKVLYDMAIISQLHRPLQLGSIDFCDTDLGSDMVKCSSASVAEIPRLARLQRSNVSK